MTETEVWERISDAGIRVLRIPTPFQVGRVNTYLLEDEPLTLIDSGPNSGKALDELEAALREHGRRIEDLERIVLTHQHTDHVGLVGGAKRLGLTLAAGLTFARLYCLPAQRNPLPQNARLSPTW